MKAIRQPRNWQKSSSDNMGKTQIVLDTSAVISLGCTGNLNLIMCIFDLHSPTRVKEELEDISKTDDEIGKIAKDMLHNEYITFHSLPNNLKSAQGEVESVNLANELKTEAIVMDDIKSMRKLEKKTKVPILFSSFIIYSLSERKIISQKEGLSALEKMKLKRQWKENLIIEYGKQLFENASIDNK